MKTHRPIWGVYKQRTERGTWSLKTTVALAKVDFIRGRARFAPVAYGCRNEDTGRSSMKAVYIQ